MLFPSASPFAASCGDPQLSQGNEDGTRTEAQLLAKQKTNSATQLHSQGDDSEPPQSPALPHGAAWQHSL